MKQLTAPGRSDDDLLAVSMGKCIVELTKPSESEFYDEIIQEIRKTERKSNSRKPLSFGVSEIANFVAPHALEVAKVVVGFLILTASETLRDATKEVVASARNQYTEKIKKWIESRFSTDKPVLSVRQKAELLSKIEVQLTKMKLNTEEKSKFLDLVKSSIVVRS